MTDDSECIDSAQAAQPTGAAPKAPDREFRHATANTQMPVTFSSGRISAPATERAAILSEVSPVGLKDLRNVGLPKKAPSKLNPIFWLPAAAKTALNSLGIGAIGMGFGFSKIGRETIGHEGHHKHPLMTGSLKAFLRLNGFTTTTRYPSGEDLRNINDSPFIIANHQSYMDGLLLAMEFE